MWLGRYVHASVSGMHVIFFFWWQLAACWECISQDLGVLTKLHGVMPGGNTMQTFFIVIMLLLIFSLFL
jgi:hypothetical protein